MPVLPYPVDVSALNYLSRIGLRARVAVEGLMAGIHRSRSFGWNIEFADYREYTKGDDIRHIDWRVFARTDRFYIKQFEEETNMRVYLVLDQSRSMDYTSGDDSKLNYAATLAAVLAYLFVRQRDSVGLVSFDRQIRQFLPPRKSPHHLRRIWETLEGLEPGEETDVRGNLHSLAGMVRRRGLMILISDLLDDPEAMIHGLAHFRHKKFEVIVLHVLDPAEVEFPFRGNSIFQDMESTKWVETSPRAIRKAYREALEGFMETVRRGCHQANVDYEFLPTSTPVERALLRYLSLRASRS